MMVCVNKVTFVKGQTYNNVQDNILRMLLNSKENGMFVQCGSGKSTFCRMTNRKLIWFCNIPQFFSISHRSETYSVSEV